MPFMPFRCLLRIFLLALFVTIKTLVFAQKDTLSTSHTLTEVFVNAPRVTQGLVHTMPFQQLDSVKLHSLGLNSWADAMYLFTAASVKDYGGVGAMKTINVRNMGAQHTNISYDGIVLSNMQVGSVDLSRYYLNNVEKVTLSLGSSETLLQSAKHFSSASLVNFSSIDNSKQSSNKNMYGCVWLKYGSFKEKCIGANYVHKINENTFFDASINHTYSKGNYPFTLKNGVFITKEERFHNQYSATNVELNLRQKFHKMGHLHTKVYGFMSQKQLPGSVILYLSQANETLSEQQMFVQSIYTTHFSRYKIWLKSIAKYAYAHTKYTDTDVKYPIGKQIDINYEKEFYASSVIMGNVFKHFQWAFSQDIIYNTLHNNLPLQVNPYRLSLLSAATLKFETHAVKIEGTLLSQHITDKTQLKTTSFKLRKLLPMVSASVCLSTKPLLYARVSYKETLRLPTFTDLYYLRFGNIHLQPEEAKLYNIGTSVKMKAFKNTTIDLNVDAYCGEIENKLVAYPTLYVWRMENFGRVKTSGYECTLQTQSALSSSLDLQTSLGYAFQRAIDHTDKQAVGYLEQLPYTPKHSLTATAHMLTKWLSIGYMFSYTSKRYSTIEHLPHSTLNAFAEHSVFFSKNIALKCTKMQCSLTLKNITNAQYQWILYYPMPGFNVQGSITINI